MSAEVPLQQDMFSGTLVDTRSASQKARDRERDKPQQLEMFAQRELAQFGVRAHPQMSLSAETKLVLISEDPRTPEEVEYDRQRAAQALTISFFPTAPPLPTEPLSDPVEAVSPLADAFTSPPIVDAPIAASISALPQTACIFSATEAWLLTSRAETSHSRPVPMGNIAPPLAPSVI